jgi:drug/metabolite transporter (DMT)-like permease
VSLATQARPERTALGVFLIVSSVFLMSIQEALFKSFSADLPLWQVFTLRGLLALPMLVIIAWGQGLRSGLWSGALQKWPLLRSLYMSLMFVAMYAAIPFISLSTVAAGIYTAPVFVTLLSAYAIGEPVDGRGSSAIVIGFTGVMIILQPGSDAFTLWAILPVLGGFFYALANVTTRSRCLDVSPVALSLSLNLALLLTGILLSAVMLVWQPADELVTAYPFLFDGWSALGATQWLLILLLAALVVAIGMGLAGAYQSAAPAIVATFDYSYLIFAALWDYLFFSTAPNGTTLVGMLLIIGAGMLVVRRPGVAHNRSSRVL